MKKSIITAILVAFLALPMFGQKYAYIDSEYILSNMPDYVEAQAELDRVALEWQQEIEKEFAKIDSMYKKYQTEVITLPENMKQKREEAIINAERPPKICRKNVLARTATSPRKERNL